MIKSLPAMQETRDQSLGREDSLEKGMATHTSILARRIPWTEELGGLQSLGSRKESDTTERVSLSMFWTFYWLHFRLCELKTDAQTFSVDSLGISIPFYISASSLSSPRLLIHISFISSIFSPHPSRLPSTNVPFSIENFLCLLTLILMLGIKRRPLKRAVWNGAGRGGDGGGAGNPKGTGWDLALSLVMPLEAGANY